MPLPKIGNNPEKSDIRAVIQGLDKIIQSWITVTDDLTVQEHPQLRARADELLRRIRGLQSDVAKELNKIPESETLIVNNGVEHRLTGSGSFWRCSCGWTGTSEHDADGHVIAAIGH